MPECALRALNLCDGQQLLMPTHGLPCYCAGARAATIAGRYGEASDLKFARAVEVARATRDPDYVARMQRWSRLAAPPEL